MDHTTMEVVQTKIDSIIPYARNPRKNKDAIDAVVSSLKEFGFRQPIVVDEEMVIVVGHTRFEAAKKLGYEEVPVHVATGLSPQQIKAYRIADNRTNENAMWDMEMLSLELEEIGDMFTGFDDHEIHDILSKEQKRQAGEDEVPSVPVVPVSVLGDIWVMGEHKVICGDSTESSTYDALLDGETVDLCWTDPPYNVDYDANKMRRGGTQHAKIENDCMTPTEFATFLTAVFKCVEASLKEGGSYYVAHCDKEAINFRQALTNNGLKIAQMLIWVKNRATLTMLDYQPQHEPILYGWKLGEAHYFIDERNHRTMLEKDAPDFDSMTKEQLLAYINAIKTDLLHHAKPTVSDLHPTMKPVSLVQECVTNSSRSGEVVLDPFGGSGSTLMACENVNRKARLIELTGMYTDVIVQRWEEYTGKSAVLQGTNKTFRQVKEERDNG